MKHLKVIGLAALACLALTAAVGANVASASEPTASGTVPQGFTGTGGTGTLSVTASSLIIHCTSSTSSGELSSSTTIQNAIVTFHGCTNSLSGGECHSEGQPSGTIKTNALHGTLVYLEAGSSTTGVLLKPASGETFATIDCPSIFGNTHMSVTGQVVAHLTPVNTEATTFTLTFSQASAGHPIPAAYLNPSGCASVSTTEALKTDSSGLVNFSKSPSAIVGTHTIHFSKAVKINSTKCL